MMRIVPLLLIAAFFAPPALARRVIGAEQEAEADEATTPAPPAEADARADAEADDVDEPPPRRSRLPPPAPKNNRLMRAGIAAGATAMAVPCAFCCASSYLCAWLPIGVTAGLAAAGAGLAPLVDDDEFDLPSTLAALGVGALGALVTSGLAIGIWLSSPVAVLSSANGSIVAYSNIHGAAALMASVAGTLATAAAVGAVVYAMTPDEQQTPDATTPGRAKRRRLDDRAAVPMLY